MKRMILLLVAGVALNAVAEEQVPSPRHYMWIVTACEGWPCANAALIAAAGSRDVVAIPTPSQRYPWVILQRVLSGSVWVPPDAPYRIDSFDKITEALPHFQAAELHAPVLLTVPDGRTLVVALAQPEPRKRAVSR